MRSLLPSSMNLLQKNMGLRLERHQVLASNIANAETPGYIAKDVEFESALRDATQQADTASQTKNFIQRTHARHLPGPLPQVIDVQGTLVASRSDDVGRDLNTVSMDQEMAKLATNTFHYNASTELLSRFFDQIKRTITEGGR
jgi:flagellar basal-body rod protein FlgB